MKFSDINFKHIYNVDFDPVEQCEFNSKHLAIVLKKNLDKKTVIVVPLTKSENGEGNNKYNMGKIPCLPSNLNNTDSYLVYNQIRTVHCKRFYALKDDFGNRINCEITDEVFYMALSLCFDELTKQLSLDEKISFYTDKYINVTMTKVVNLAYDIKRIETNMQKKEVEIIKLQSKIYGLLHSNIEYNKYISDVDKNNGIMSIIENCLQIDKN